MSFYDVIRRFELLSGLEGQGLSKWSDLCRQAMEDVKLMLKVPEDSLTEGMRLRLAYTAGALAFYKYCLYISFAEPQSFEAGEVRVTMSDSKVQAARTLFEEECKGLAHILCDKGFYFGRVKA